MASSSTADAVKAEELVRVVDSSEFCASECTVISLHNKGNSMWRMVESVKHEACDYKFPRRRTGSEKRLCEQEGRRRGGVALVVI